MIHGYDSLKLSKILSIRAKNFNTFTKINVKSTLSERFSKFYFVLYVSKFMTHWKKLASQEWIL